MLAADRRVADDLISRMYGRAARRSGLMYSSGSSAQSWPGSVSHDFASDDRGQDGGPGIGVAHASTNY
jgi:hypothetical protein